MITFHAESAVAAESEGNSAGEQLTSVASFGRHREYVSVSALKEEKKKSIPKSRLTEKTSRVVVAVAWWS